MENWKKWLLASSAVLALLVLGVAIAGGAYYFTTGPEKAPAEQVVEKAASPPAPGDSEMVVVADAPPAPVAEPAADAPPTKAESEAGTPPTEIQILQDRVTRLETFKVWALAHIKLDCASELADLDESSGEDEFEIARSQHLSAAAIKMQLTSSAIRPPFAATDLTVEVTPLVTKFSQTTDEAGLPTCKAETIDGEVMRYTTKFDGSLENFVAYQAARFQAIGAERMAEEEEPNPLDEMYVFIERIQSGILPELHEDAMLALWAVVTSLASDAGIVTTVGEWLTFVNEATPEPLIKALVGDHGPMAVGWLELAWSAANADVAETIKGLYAEDGTPLESPTIDVGSAGEEYLRGYFARRYVEASKGPNGEFLANPSKGDELLSVYRTYMLFAMKRLGDKNVVRKAAGEAAVLKTGTPIQQRLAWLIESYVIPPG